MNLLFDRLREPSSMAGLPAIGYGIDQLFGSGAAAGDAAQVGAVLQDAVPQLLCGNWIGGGFSLVFGLGAVFLAERGATPRTVSADRRYVDQLDPSGRGGGGLY